MAGLDLCAPLAGLYRAGWAAKRAWTRRRPPIRLGVPVVSLGNLTTGGTGKTEATAAVAAMLRGEGWRPAVLSRGYGRRGAGAMRVVSRGNGPELPVRQAGDEPYLLARRLAGTAVVVGADRIQTGRLAAAELGCDVMILDDGFQRRDQLARDADIVLIDAKDSLAGARLLPCGRLREPPEMLAEADAFLLTRADQADPTPARDLLARLAPGKPCWRVRHVPMQWRPLASGTGEPVEALRGRRLLAVCGIARPEAFRATLTGLGCRIEAFEAYPDHHWFTRSEQSRLAARARGLGAEIMMTAKDAVRWRGPAPDGVRVGFLEVALQWLDDPPGWRRWLRGRLDHRRTRHAS